MLQFINQYSTLFFETGVFGVITNENKGTMTFSSATGTFPTVNVPVTNGSLAPPTLGSVRGTIRAVFNGTGKTAAKTFTKAESPYALGLTAQSRELTVHR